MTHIDPAKFIVRSGSYPQDEEYGPWCAKLTEDLLARGERGEIKSFNDLYNAICEAQQAQGGHEYITQGEGYGETRVTKGIAT